jgi:hypothetical protein
LLGIDLVAHRKHQLQIFMLSEGGYNGAEDIQAAIQYCPLLHVYKRFVGGADPLWKWWGNITRSSSKRTLNMRVVMAILSAAGYISLKVASGMKVKASSIRGRKSFLFNEATVERSAFLRSQSAISC